MVTRDPDNIYDDDVIAVLEIKCRRNGSMSVAGSIADLRYALAMLENAKDAVRNHHARLSGRTKLLVPGPDTELPELPPELELPR